jgi:folate-binding protein YgfZ
MTEAHIAELPDRGIVAVTGEAARDFLDNLLTNDMVVADAKGAMHAALLTPQGKIMFEFFVVKVPDGYLLDTARATAPDLVKRLTLYRLRAKVAINDLSASRVVLAAWGGRPPDMPLATIYADPRSPDLGVRIVMAPEMAGKLAAGAEGAAAYHRHRIRAGVPDGGRDYPIGDTFVHEANFDRLGGVSFTKGCFVGQEVVARMQHKTVVRKRVVPVTGDAPLTVGAEIMVGEASIGRVGSVDGVAALALLRLDRALEARTKGQTLTSDGVALTVDAAALDAFDAAAKARSA